MRCTGHLVEADALHAVVCAETRTHVRTEAVNGNELRVAGLSFALPDQVPQLNSIRVIQHLHGHGNNMWVFRNEHCTTRMGSMGNSDCRLPSCSACYANVIAMTVGHDLHAVSYLQDA